MKTIRVFFLALAVAGGCVDPFELGDSGASGMLVVEGVFSDQVKKHQIFLSRATSVNEKRTLREVDADVRIISDLQEVIDLAEVAPGVYETPETAAAPGRSYALEIKTSNGEEYRSSAEAFNDGPSIGNVYARYGENPQGEGKGVQVYLDTGDPDNRGHYYRWNFIETYEVRAPFPSNWVWLGGNDVEFRIDGIDTCFVSDTLTSVVLRDTHSSIEDKIDQLPLRFIPESSYILRHKYSILVQQFSLSQDAYRYWDNLRVISEEQGSLSDRQPGSLRGNMHSVSNPAEIVLGYFEVGKVSEQRIFFSAITFYNDGMRMPKPLRSDCFDVPPITMRQDEMGRLMPRYEQAWYIWEVAGMTPNILVSLMPKSCCDCRNLGPTERPDFF